MPHEISIADLLSRESMAVWTLGSSDLASAGLTPSTVDTNVAALLSLLHDTDDDIVPGPAEQVRRSQGPFTVLYPAQVKGRSLELMLIGQFSHGDDGASGDASGYVINLTPELSRATGDAVRANNEKRATIEQAKGAFMMAYGISEAEAFTVLASLSQRTNLKLRDIAETVVSMMNDKQYRDLHCSQTLLNVTQIMLSGTR